MSSLELPPRRHLKGQELTIRRNRTSLEILLQMGFPKHRAEKALAATGDRGVQLACDWLLSHVRDPHLDDLHSSREYILYLSPTGPLQQLFLDFWQRSFVECGWNRAHCYFPHITLCSFFKSPNNLVSHLSHTIKSIIEKQLIKLEKLEFDFFSSANFVGLFITEQYSKIFKKLTSDFVAEMKKAGVEVKQQKKPLHISLAYQFAADKRARLEGLARGIQYQNTPAKWEVRLYSREASSPNQQVRKVLYTYVATMADELELYDRDYVIVNGEEVDVGGDGWVGGMSWMTGCSGVFPLAYSERCAETETWTLHRSIPVVNVDLQIDSEQSGPSQWTTDQNNATPSNPSTPTPESRYLDSKSLLTPLLSNHLEVITESGESLEKRKKEGGGGDVEMVEATAEAPYDPQEDTKEDCYGPLPDVAATHHSSASRPFNSPINYSARHQAISPLTAPSTRGSRQLFVVRHGERVDFTFGKQWSDCSFNQNGDYIRYDLNMPGSLPKRKGAPTAFDNDSPITVQGHFQARLLGEAMLEKGIEISHVYASPSLRCVETASSILQGMKLRKQINIEPGLFEWLSWFHDNLPSFMTSQELNDAGYPVSQSYRPVWPVSKYNTSETIEDFYDRSFLVVKEILRHHEDDGGSLLLVSHGINLDTCTRRLVGQPCRSFHAFHETLQKIPYCAMAAAQEATVVRDTWYLIEPPVLPFAHTSNARYNWTLLTQPNYA